MSAAEDLRRVEEALRKTLETQQENTEAAVREVQDRLERQRGS